MRRSLFIAVMSTFLVGAAVAAENPALTIYRADGDSLFENGGSPVADGYAVVHEQRLLKLSDARQLLVVDGLPAMLDAEAISIDLGGAARVLSQRVLSSGEGGALAAHRRENVVVVLRDGGTVQGMLLGIDNGALIMQDDASQHVSYVRDYNVLRFAQGSGLPGSTLQINVEGKIGDLPAALTYPTSGLGWRAAYSARLLDGSGCRMRLDALASIANRSGRDYGQAALKLIAGSPNLSRSSGARPMMMKSMAMAAPAPASSDALPEQSSLGDYRNYTIANPLDLPDASVTQVPLYASREVDCQRAWIVESGGAWFPPQPMTSPSGDTASSSPVVSEIRFTTTENLPAGNLRVLTRDRDGRIEFLGESHLADTQKGRPVPVTLGNAFDLSANRERTTFSVDKAAHEMNEGFRITLTNTGDAARTISVREHPNRWRGWTLLSSSQKPSKQTPDTLEFDVAVPANGKATLDYVVHYQWTAHDNG